MVVKFIVLLDVAAAIYRGSCDNSTCPELTGHCNNRGDLRVFVTADNRHPFVAFGIHRSACPTYAYFRYSINQCFKVTG